MAPSSRLQDISSCNIFLAFSSESENKYLTTCHQINAIYDSDNNAIYDTKQEKVGPLAQGGVAIDGRGWLMGRGARRRPRLLATKLREIRDGLSLSQGALIERLGVGDYINQGEISDFEHGVREPDLLTLKAYADVAGISADVLIDDDAKLPDTLPGAKYTIGTGGKPQKGRPKATINTATVTLRLLIESDDGHAGAEQRARATIEKNCLKQHRVKKLKGDEYELTFSQRDDPDLDKQIYALFGAIIIQARKRKCSVKVDIREKDGDRHW